MEERNKAKDELHDIEKEIVELSKKREDCVSYEKMNWMYALLALCIIFAVSGVILYFVFDMANYILTLGIPFLGFVITIIVGKDDLLSPSNYRRKLKTEQQELWEKNNPEWVQLRTKRDGLTEIIMNIDKQLSNL